MSQVEKLHDLMGDLKPHRTDEIVAVVYGQGLSLARVGARIHDLKKRIPPQFTIKGWHDKDNPALYWYQLCAIEQRNDGELFPRRFWVTG